MTNQADLHLTQLTDPQAISTRLRRELIDCWVAVTNSGGAAGFPFPPVDAEQVAPVADAIFGRLDRGHSRLLTATCDNVLAGWVVLSSDPNPLVAHGEASTICRPTPRF